MLEEFVARVSSGLQQKGYLTDLPARVPGVQVLLYSRSPKRIRLGAAKVEDHFLFVDWDNAVFGQLHHLKETYRRFRSYANQGFRTPHILRMQIPNLAIIAVSQAEFPDDALFYARTTSLSPWYGGEVGQVILVETGNQRLISLDVPEQGRFPRRGAFALGHASNLIREVCERAF